jgi:hypothetical protein
VEYLSTVFGDSVRLPTHESDNSGRYFDQKLISMLIANANITSVEFIPRNIRRDRIDRSSWKVPESIINIVDANLLTSAYSPNVWPQLMPLIIAMYGNGTDRYWWSIRYFENFQRVFVIQKIDDMVAAELP